MNSPTKEELEIDIRVIMNKIVGHLWMKSIAKQKEMITERDWRKLMQGASDFFASIARDEFQQIANDINDGTCHGDIGLRYKKFEKDSKWPFLSDKVMGCKNE